MKLSTRLKTYKALKYIGLGILIASIVVALVIIAFGTVLSLIGMGSFFPHFYHFFNDSPVGWAYIAGVALIGLIIYLISLIFRPKRTSSSSSSRYVYRSSTEEEAEDHTFTDLTDDDSRRNN